MTATAEKLRADLLALPEEDRVELAYLLLDSVESEQPEDDPAFIAELERRKADHLSGKSPGIPLEEALAQLDAHLAARRK